MRQAGRAVHLDSAAYYLPTYLCPPCRAMPPFLSPWSAVTFIAITFTLPALHFLLPPFFLFLPLRQEDGWPTACIAGSVHQRSLATCAMLALPEVRRTNECPPIAPPTETKRAPNYALHFSTRHETSCVFGPRIGVMKIVLMRMLLC